MLFDRVALPRAVDGRDATHGLCGRFKGEVVDCELGATMLLREIGQLGIELCA